MINTSGIRTIVGDADSLIALLAKSDASYTLATITSKELLRLGTRVIYPATAIAEAITALARKHSNPNLAAYLCTQYQNGVFDVVQTDGKIMQEAAKLFVQTSSKQNTFFDAIVAATAGQYQADAIFSFDKWYKKLGFALASDLL